MLEMVNEMAGQRLKPPLLYKEELIAKARQTLQAKQG
jgi:hypothetical protein